MTLALAGAAAVAAPLPLGSEVAIDPTPGIYFGCPALAGHDDGTFAMAWARSHATADTELVVRAGDADGGLGPAREVAAQRQALIELLSLAATPAGYTLLWQGQVDARRPHLALELDDAGRPSGEPLDLARIAVGVSPRPVGGFVTHWVSGPRTIKAQRRPSTAGWSPGSATTAAAARRRSTTSSTCAASRGDACRPSRTS